MELRLLTQYQTNCTVEFLPVYTPSAEEMKDDLLYSVNVQKTMAKALGIPTTQHSYPDMFLAKIARKSHTILG